MFKKIVCSLMVSGAFLGGANAMEEVKSIVAVEPRDPFAPVRLTVYQQDPGILTEDPNFGDSVTKVITIKGNQGIFNGPSDHDFLMMQNPVQVKDFMNVKIGTPQFDSVHAYGTIRSVYDMWDEGLINLVKMFPKDTTLSSATLDWANKGRLYIYPHSGEDMNAYYCRDGGQRQLRFFDFMSPKDGSKISTVQSADVVAHESGHSILDVFKPKYFDTNALETGGFHEAFGDMSSLLYVFNQRNLVDDLLRETEGDLHRPNFAARLAEQFGVALGQNNGLRNADGNMTLSKSQKEVHAISEVFVDAFYKSLVSAFNTAQNQQLMKGSQKNEVLEATANYMKLILLNGILQTPGNEPSFSDFACSMIDVSQKSVLIPDLSLKDLNWKDIFTTEFQKREIFVNVGESKKQTYLADRIHVCGTMVNLSPIKEDFSKLGLNDNEE